MGAFQILCKAPIERGFAKPLYIGALLWEFCKDPRGFAKPLGASQIPQKSVLKRGFAMGFL